MLIAIGWFSRALFALLLLALTPLVHAQRQAPEPELKAAILVNMLLFVDWPIPAARSPDRLTVCYLAAGPVATALEQLGGKLIRGQSLQVVRADAATLGACHVLYISPTDASSLPRIASSQPASGVLLVGDSPGYLQRGVMFNLEIEGGRVVFDLDLRSVRQAGLIVSSKVLRLARHVTE
jgi:hypothetical protein